MKKVVELIISLVPLGIGFGFLIEVWSTPSRGFGGLPVSMKVVFSCVASLVVMLGLAGIYGVFKGGGPFELATKVSLKRMVRDLAEMQRELKQDFKESGIEPANDQASSAATNYQCPNCGATLGDRADVSPHGDAKCPHCNRWFNIHRTA